MPRKRWCSPWMLAWLVVTAVMVGIDAGVWILHLDGVIRPIANVTNMLTAPGRMFLRASVGGDARVDLFWIVVVNAVSWGLYLAVLGVMAELIRPSRRPQGVAMAEPAPADPSRRAFLAKGGLGVAGVSLSAGSAYATIAEPWDLHVDRVTVPIRDLPDGLVGMRVVQISDTHMGPRIPRSFIASAVERAIGLKPDLIALTGDYACISEAYIDDAVSVLGPLVGSARLGVVGVLGNHDHWLDGPRISRMMSDLGIRMIDNGRVFVSTDGMFNDFVPGSICVAGLGDLIGDTVRPDRAFRAVPDQTPRLTLAHHPDTAELPEFAPGVAPRVDLMLCGHTHGGQVKLPFLGTPAVPSDFGDKYAAGMVQGPSCRVFVSKGVGMSVLPVRFRVPPEINLITLVRASNADD